MAKVTQITVSHGATINLGNYESERYDVSITATLDEGDQAHIIAAELALEAMRLLAHQLTQVLDGDDHSRLDVLRSQPYDLNRKISFLKHRPEFPWIERLYPRYAQEMIDLLSESSSQEQEQERAEMARHAIANRNRSSHQDQMDTDASAIDGSPEDFGDRS